MTFDARNLFRALSHSDVAYVTIGGIAVQAHGGQRLTQDLDIAIDPASENVERLAAALRELDARILGSDGGRSAEVPPAALLASSDQWHLITAHGPLDVIVLPAALGPFAELRARAHEVPLGGVTVPVAAREDLIRMKRASARPQDQADAELLESLGGDEGDIAT